MEGDPFRGHQIPFTFVSIHALAWRATVIGRNEYVYSCVSIHALAWRATQLYLGVRGGGKTVSIHALAWRATERYTKQSHMKVSIHALAWRATLLGCFNHDTKLVSIHALAWRAT